MVAKGEWTVSWREWGRGRLHWRWQRWMAAKEKDTPLLPSCQPSGWATRGPPVRPGYLDGALHDERRELGHHQVHTLKAGLFQFEDLLFDNRLKGQVGGEEPRPEDTEESAGVGVGGCFCRSGRQAETEGQAEIRGTKGGKKKKRTARKKRGEKREGRKKEVVLQLVGSRREKKKKEIQPEDKPQVSHPLFQQASSSTVTCHVTSRLQTNPTLRPPYGLLLPLVSLLAVNHEP